MDGEKVMNGEDENSYINEKIEEFLDWNKVYNIMILCIYG